MRIYTDLASWYPLLTPRVDYKDEAVVYQRILRSKLGQGPLRLVELGCGAGHNASYFTDFDLTLTDLSTDMLQLAQLNCAGTNNGQGARCIQGDMRSLRLGQTFDAVLLHDAVDYMVTQADLAACFATAFVHLRPHGCLLVTPDVVAETFTPTTYHEGVDGDGRALRYLEWSWQAAGQTECYTVDYTMVMRTGDAEPVIVNDRHVVGMFSRSTWLKLLAQAGFTVVACEIADPDHPDLFLACKGAG